MSDLVKFGGPVPVGSQGQPQEALGPLPEGLKPEWLWFWFVKGLGLGEGIETGNLEKTWASPFLTELCGLSGAYGDHSMQRQLDTVAGDRTLPWMRTSFRGVVSCWGTS